MDYIDDESKTGGERLYSDEASDKSRIRRPITWIFEDELKIYLNNLREIRERGALTKPRDTTDL